jgi:sulfate transport system substrate-binding protein
MKTSKIRALIGVTVSGVMLATASSVMAQTSILNVSYDVSRELYKDINPAFVASWQAKGNPPLTINQSHGGSSKQVIPVIILLSILSRP